MYEKSKITKESNLRFKMEIMIRQQYLSQDLQRFNMVIY